MIQNLKTGLTGNIDNKFNLGTFNVRDLKDLYKKESLAEDVDIYGQIHKGLYLAFLKRGLGSGYLISSALIVPLNESPLVRKFPLQHTCSGRQGI